MRLLTPNPNHKVESTVLQTPNPKRTRKNTLFWDLGHETGTAVQKQQFFAENNSFSLKMTVFR